MPAGRPTKYKKDYCNQVIEHMRNGSSLASFAASIGTHRGVIWKWRQRYPEFSDACQVAIELSLVWWQEFSLKICTGEAYLKTDSNNRSLRPNAGMVQFEMSRRFKEYNYKTIVEDQTEDESINIELSSDKLENEINKRLERRKRRRRATRTNEA